MAQVETTTTTTRQLGNPAISVGDILVVCAMMIVAVALAAGLLVNTGVGVVYSGLGAIIVLLGMISAHVVARRGRFSRRSDSEPKARRHHLPKHGPDGWPEPPGRSRSEGSALPPLQTVVPPQYADEHGQAGRPVLPRAEAPVSYAHVEPPETIARDADASAKVVLGPSEMGEAKAMASGARGSQEKDLGSVVPDRGRLSDDDLPEADSGSRAPAKGAEIETIIKRLADDITAGRRTLKPIQPLSIPDVRLQHQAGSRTVEAAPAQKPARAEPPTLPMPPKAHPPIVPAQAAPAPDVKPAVSSAKVTASSQVAAIADALMAERIDVFLEPIHGLEDNRARHYEVFARLRLEDGAELDREAYADIVRGTGLLPLIEAVKLSQTKRVAMQLMERGRSGSFFSQIDGEALFAAQFGEDAGTIAGRDAVIATRLVLSFSQSDVRGFTPAQWRTLEELQGLGFRFAIEGVTDLDMDFERLAEAGFQFAKLDAQVFIAGLPIGDTTVPATDICKYLASMGLTLIIQSIASERQLVEILGFGALFGQGVLFGGPRPVKAHVLRGDPRAESGLSV
jgi:EAL domain-containing protein (putative c-di-GMP-specific phosphodiesterase class I)